ncbi:MAG: hypothetical protein WBV77_07775 [Solirubrobacteraceae bacterium]
MTTIPNWLAVLGLLVPSGTGLAGYILAGRNEEARDERTAKREAVARRISARERLEEQRHALQRETLLELQDALQRQVRCAAKVIFHDQQTVKQHGTLTQIGEELNEESYRIGVTVRRLKERVLDPELRVAIEQFHNHVSGLDASVVVVKEMSAQDGIKHLGGQLMNLTNHYTSVSDLMGTSLRVELGWLPEEVQSERGAA